MNDKKYILFLPDTFMIDSKLIVYKMVKKTRKKIGKKLSEGK